MAFVNNYDPRRGRTYNLWFLRPMSYLERKHTLRRITLKQIWICIPPQLISVLPETNKIKGFLFGSVAIVLLNNPPIMLNVFYGYSKYLRSY
jgi:hypothetical protein